jgi:hypothetical protein
MILLALAVIIFARSRSGLKGRLAQLSEYRGWRRIIVVLSVMLALMIVLNPEFMALGFLGDAAFFDILVLAVGFQLQIQMIGLHRAFAASFSKAMQWAGVPSPGLRYLMTFCSLAFGRAVSASKRVHRSHSIA